MCFQRWESEYPQANVNRIDFEWVQSTMKIRIHISLKNGVLDPQGKAIENALTNLGFDKVENVRQGKFIELDIRESDPAEARKQATEMCEKLLANTVIENYRVDLE